VAHDRVRIERRGVAAWYEVIEEAPAQQ